METTDCQRIGTMNASEDYAIFLRNASKTFYIQDIPMLSIRDYVMNIFKPNKKRAIRALQNINLDVRPGEFLGVIGRNGSGKSTLLHVITGAYPVDKGGEVITRGNFIRLSLGIGFDYELSARENIYINASILGLPIAQIDKKFDDIIEFSELHDFVDTRVKYFSSGMVSRLAFAVALHAEADIFLMDEYFGGVGDEKFNEKCRDVFQRTFIDNRTIVHVSHNLDTIRAYSDRVLLLHHGEMIALGKPDEVIEAYNRILTDG